MAHDEIEFSEPNFSTCTCCGQITTHLTRFVSREGAAFAVYFAAFAPGHDYVSVLAGFGNWHEDAPPTERVAFALRIWVSNDSYQVGLVGPEDAFWQTTHLGSILSREDGLAHPLKAEAFALSDHIVECDEPVVQFLSQFS